MGFIETSYGSSPNLSDVNIDSILNMGNYGIAASGNLNILNTMDLNNNDLIGVKRFMCDDFFTALKATASDDQKANIIVDNFTTTIINTVITWDKLIRIPSNIIQNSTIRIKFYIVVGGSNVGVEIRKYDPITQTYTVVDGKSYHATTAEWLSFDFTAKGGELYTFVLFSNTLSTYLDFQQGIKICYDAAAVVDSVWEVIE